MCVCVYIYIYIYIMLYVNSMHIAVNSGKDCDFHDSIEARQLCCWQSAVQ